jgi:protein required for attachment to host cells
MVTRIVVSDQAEARFYDVVRPGAPLRLAGLLEDPAAHLHDRDFQSDRPGRVFDRAPGGGQRRGATARHATGGEQRPRKHAAQLFARRIARELGAASRAGQFDRLALVAGPAFLGLLRAALTKRLKECVVAEVPKDLVHQPKTALRSRLPRAALGYRPVRSAS